MTLKINYLDNKKTQLKNNAIFVHSNTKIDQIKGKFEDKITQKILNLIKKNKLINENKIFSLGQDFDEKIVIIYLHKLKQKNTELEFEKLGGKFYDFLKKNDAPRFCALFTKCQSCGMEFNPQNCQKKMFL